MLKRSTLFFTCVAVGTGIGLFQVKYSVVTLEQEYAQTQKRTHENLESLHVLKAEWAHLNDPKRLQELSKKHLGIGPIKSVQFIPMRALAPSQGSYDKYALDQLISDVIPSGGVA